MSIDQVSSVDSQVSSLNDSTSSMITSPTKSAEVPSDDDIMSCGHNRRKNGIKVIHFSHSGPGQDTKYTRCTICQPLSDDVVASEKAQANWPPTDGSVLEIRLLGQPTFMPTSGTRNC